MTEFYRGIVEAGDLCFDVGAHLGNRARVLAALGCRVVAVEPHPYLASYLRKKFVADSSVLVEENAVAATASMATLLPEPDSPTIATISPGETA